MPPENAIPLYTHNFTRINDDCTGNFTLAEHINGSQLHNDDFPICPSSSRPLNNANIYHGGGYRVQNLDITNPGGNAAMFGFVNNTDIDLILENPRVEGSRAATILLTIQSNNRIKATFYKGGYVKGVSDAGLIASNISGNNNHIIHVGGDNETLTIEAESEAGGTVYRVSGNSNHLEQQGGSIFVEATGDLASRAGGVVARLDIGSYNNLIQSGNRIKVEGRTASGAISRVNQCSHTAVNQIQCQVEVTGGRAATGGFILSGSSSNNNTLTQVNNFIAVSATDSDGKATSGLQITERVSSTTLIQTNNQMNITGAQKTSALITTGTGRNSQGTRLLLYSGGLGDNKNTTVCPDNNNPPVTGLVDIAGYNVDAQSCPAELIRLNSTQPDDWHHAQQSFCEYATCKENSSCHYPNEQLQAVVPAGNNALWLVTRQGYPSNPASDRISPVRISRFLANDTVTGNGISPDNSFGTEGVRVLTPSPFNFVPLPDTLPVAQIADQNRLSLLYAPTEKRGVLLVNLPLNTDTDDYYDTHIIPELRGQPVLLSQDAEEGSNYLWTREQDGGSDILLRYTLSFTNLFHAPDAEYNLTNADYPNVPVIGLGIDSQWLYVARHQGSNVIMERLDLITAQLDNWSATLEDIPVAINSTGLPYRLEPAGNQLYLVPVVEGVLQPEYSATPKAFRVTWPQYGGCAQWISYSPQSVMLDELTASPSPAPSNPVPSSPVPSNPAPNPDNPDHTGAIVGSVFGGSVLVAGAAAAGVIALIKYKKLKQAQCYLPSR